MKEWGYTALILAIGMLIGYWLGIYNCYKQVKELKKELRDGI